jgi:thioesterase domain-containing protein
LQVKGDQPTLFLVHGVGGGMFWGYRNLARHLGPDQPVYVFSSRGLDGQAEFERIEDMAAYYVRDLRRFQPHGPYFLGGYCFGGNVAFEMAQQLVADGEQVAFLGLINCSSSDPACSEFRWTPGTVGRFLWNVCYRVGYYVRYGSSQRRSLFIAKLKWWTGRVFGYSMVSSEQPPDRRKLWQTHINALTHYRPKPYVGHITVLRTRGYPLVCSFDPLLGWGNVACGRVTVRTTTGEHESILEEPHVASVAAELASCLAAAAKRARGTVKL